MTNPLQNLQESISQIEERLKVHFSHPQHLIAALIHRSFANENPDLTSEYNERLEFLGDAVLGTIVSDFLFRKFPNLSEGDLSHFRSRLVDMPTCAAYLEKLAMSEFLLVGKGEQMEGRGRTSILADLFEALIGAIYLDGGLEKVDLFYFDHFQNDVLAILDQPHHNWKAELQDFSQKKFQEPPVYQVLKEEGPDHAKVFHVAALVNGKELGRGIGPSKKEAEQDAAEQAVHRIGSL